jgi:hypothetical protein
MYTGRIGANQTKLEKEKKDEKEWKEEEEEEEEHREKFNNELEVLIYNIPFSF